MSFAKRVIRMSSPALKLTKAEELNDSGLLAAENLSIFPHVEDELITPPRASGLHDACMRKLVLGVKYERRKKDYLGAAEIVTFAIGNSLHSWAQNTSDVFGDKRRGRWRCSGCGHIVPFGPPPTYKCPKCGARPEAFIYHEWGFAIKNPFIVSGHPDMFIEKPGSVFRIVEIKSMGEQYEKLKAPLVQHEWQVLTYMLCSMYDRGLPVKIDHRLGYVLYISKKHAPKGKLPFKMYAVKNNPIVVKSIKEKLFMYQSAVQGGPLPPVKQKCSDSKWSSYEAKFCPVKDLCMKGEE